MESKCSDAPRCWGRAVGHDLGHHYTHTTAPLANGTCVGSDAALFPVLFELVSAFGNVGLSLGSYAHVEAGDPLLPCLSRGLSFTLLSTPHR
jgi:hypothetical protein